MDQSHQTVAVQLLRSKLQVTRTALNEACQALDSLDRTMPSPNFTAYRSDRFDIAQSSGQAFAAAVPAPSIFCLDILEMIGSVRAQLIEQVMQPPESQSSIENLIQRALLALVTERWSWTTHWYFETMGLEKLLPITRYLVLPTVENCTALLPQFRPTNLQLTKFHWPSIDWIPFPALRDKIIEHASELSLTDVILFTMQCYCMEVESTEGSYGQGFGPQLGTTPRGSIIPAPQNQGRYYRLVEYLDYIRAREAPENAGIDQQQPLQMLKDVEAKFILSLSSPEVFFKLEHAFFERFPLLYCDEALVKGHYASIFG